MLKSVINPCTQRGNNYANIMAPLLREQHNISLLTLHNTGILLYNFIVVNYAQAITKYNKWHYYVFIVFDDYSCEILFLHSAQKMNHIF